MQIKQVVALVSFLAIPTANAAVPFYLGGSASLVTADSFDSNSYNEDLSFDFSQTSEDKEGTGYRVMGGLTLAPWVALEAGYSDFGKASFTTVSNGPPCCITAYYQTGPVSGQTASSGIDIGLLLQWPLPNDITVGARAGLLKWTVKPEVRDSGGEHVVANRKGDDFFYGFDVRIPVADQVSIALDYNRYNMGASSTSHPPRMDDYQVSALSAGLVVTFGRH